MGQQRNWAQLELSSAFSCLPHIWQLVVVGRVWESADLWWSQQNNWNLMCLVLQHATSRLSSRQREENVGAPFHASTCIISANSWPKLAAWQTWNQLGIIHLFVGEAADCCSRWVGCREGWRVGPLMPSNLPRKIWLRKRERISELLKIF